MSNFRTKLNEYFFTVEEFVDYVGIISVSGTYNKVRQGAIPSKIIENKIYIPRGWVKEHYDDVIDEVIGQVANNG